MKKGTNKKSHPFGEALNARKATSECTFTRAKCNTEFIILQHPESGLSLLRSFLTSHV